MPREPTTSALRDLRALFDAATTAGLSDEQLLRRYADRRAGVGVVGADAAFATLVDRHGPMVWGVCRRALGNAHEAEDAFQATFLVLARRADAVRVDGSLGRWLHGVASRVASRARADGLRRLARERRAATGEPSSHPPDLERDELLAALDEELGRLPEKYRSPMVLCHLEGLTYAGAAEQLGCPPGTIKGRLAKGRELLRARLARRGLGLPASATGALILPGAGPAVPPSLAESTARLGPAIARPAAVAGVSTSVLTLAKGVIRTMILMRWAKILALLAPASAPVGFWFLAAGPAPKVVEAPTARAKGPAPGAGRVAPDEPGRPTSAIAVPLPGRDDLRDLLRRVAGEAIAIASKQPQPSSWTLTTIAKAQASAGDSAGAKETFAVAAREAGGDFGGQPYAWNLWRVGHSQAEAGLRDDARPTLRRALETTPGVIRDFDKDWWSLKTLAAIVKEQAGIGDRDEARRTADRLKAFAAELFAKSETSNAEEVVAPQIAGALAAVDDFDGVFKRAGAFQHTDRVIGEAALAATKYLDRAQARRFIEEAVARMAGITSADQKYMGLGDLAEARALIGDFEGAKASARSIGVGPNRADYDMTDGQPYALLRVAGVQRKAGQVEPARETLREAYRIIIDHPKMRGPEGRLLQVAMGQDMAGDIEGALRTAESMPEGRRAETLAMIARSQAIAGKGGEARKTIDRALADARTNVKAPPAPNPEVVPSARAKPFPPDTSAMMQLAEIQAMAGDPVEALKSLGAIVDENYRRFALEKIVTARAAAGDVKGALDLAIKDARTTEERRSALEGVGQGVWTRLLLESPARAGE